MEKLISFFNQITPLDDEMLALMKGLFKNAELKKGEYFIKKADYAKEIAFLEEGYVRAYYVTG
ncbi:MAG: hypothetical protein R3321_12975, partial [Nitrososphaeraceae archaeon]|nr:hypothetical protein [Nitrososphaeraceae archaeon]